MLLAGWVLAVVVLQAWQGRQRPDVHPFGDVCGIGALGSGGCLFPPLFFLIRPLVAPLAREARRLRAAILAAAGATPSLVVAIFGWWLLSSLDTRGEPAAGLDLFAVLALCVSFGVGAFAAAEMWTSAFPAAHDRRAPFEDYRDITLAVRVKEDLEVLRLLLVNNALTLLTCDGTFCP